MKRLIIGSIATIILSLAPALAFGSEVSTVKTKSEDTSTSLVNQTQPFNLVFLGKQGFFVEQGIPSGAIFLHSISTGKVTAESLIEAGIAEGRLHPDTINDQGYILSVENLLQDLDRT